MPTLSRPQNNFRRASQDACMSPPQEHHRLAAGFELSLTISDRSARLEAKGILTLSLGLFPKAFSGAPPAPHSLDH